jgi:DNA polymerase-3 subunit epsilon
MYTIIDVETTGRSNRITEISIFKYDGTRVVDEFTSLVNPGIVIPVYITVLTNIDNATVANAPYFEAIADRILEITEDTVFVAHNVNFDYNVIRGEFKRLGLTFDRKKLCTVRLSRQLFKGLPSYSLGKLCKSLDIPITERHRARGDAEATVTLFQKLLAQEEAPEVFKSFMKANSRQGTLPPNLSEDVFNTLPETTGIYFFVNKKKDIIYVGKAKNIKKRVLSHFYDKKQKELDLCRETAHINFELSGSETLALLMEDAAIKQHFPKYNRASKIPKKSYSLFNYTDRKGVIHFATNLSKLAPYAILTFHSKRDVILYMETLCTQFKLCPKYCNLQAVEVSCDHYKITSCAGVCKGTETIERYNQRVTLAVEAIKNKHVNNIIKLEGRDANEDAVILIENGIYKGYGFISKEEELPYTDNADIQRILRKVM